MGIMKNKVKYQSSLYRTGKPRFKVGTKVTAKDIATHKFHKGEIVSLPGYDDTIDHHYDCYFVKIESGIELPFLEKELKRIYHETN